MAKAKPPHNSTNIMKSSVLPVLLIAALAALTSAHAASAPAAPKQLHPARTALLVTDPQNDFLSPKGVTWGLVGQNVTENRTVEHIEQLLQTAKQNKLPVFISPHYYYPTDHHWHFGGTIEKVMHKIGMFDRNGALNLKDFEGSGADWLERYKQYINDGATVVTSPHKVYGPESNDLALQLRKRRIETVILAGMSANLCVESHLRELLEEGFEVIVVKDATAAAVSPELGDGYKAATTNFGFIANEVVTTDEIVARISARQ
jgi:nicotinamidase-related amidase